MSNFARTWAYEQHCGETRQSGRHRGSYKGNPTAKFVLLNIAEFANENGECWASQETLAEMTDCEVRTVRNALVHLEKLGLIERSKRRRSDGSRSTDMIYLKAPADRLKPKTKKLKNRHAEKFSGSESDNRKSTTAQPENDDIATGKLLQDNRKTTAEPPENFSGPIENEPLGEPSGEPKREPNDTTASPSGGKDPVTTILNLTIERTREVGFDPARHQIVNWYRGWEKFVLVGEGESPPDSETQFSVLAEIVWAARGGPKRARFFRSVPDAVKIVEGRLDRERPRNGYSRRDSGWRQAPVASDYDPAGY